MSKTKAEPIGSILPLPLQFLAAWLAVWLERILQQQIDYLKAENRALKEKLGSEKLHLTDTDRPRQAARPKGFVRSRYYRDAGDHPALVSRAGGQEV